MRPEQHIPSAEIAYHITDEFNDRLVCQDLMIMVRTKRQLWGRSRKVFVCRELYVVRYFDCVLCKLLQLLLGAFNNSKRVERHAHFTMNSRLDTARQGLEIDQAQLPYTWNIRLELFNHHAFYINLGQLEASKCIRLGEPNITGVCI
ncbi:hypothetical protein HYQ46_003266 [Verticillium longisporum]|nr:hypothetical protein HYQ46_003266 [Verticillium longisporum]